MITCLGFFLPRTDPGLSRDALQGKVMVKKSPCKNRTIRLNGLEMAELRGGFLAYFNIREDRKNRRGSAEKVVARLKPRANTDFLICRQCGTIIQVSPPGRAARCCQRPMAPLGTAQE